ncbi:MAG: hypothetical protein KC877_01670 [Candidatus Kaiserbacteria bacterium]|nr:hypothetical protein [Candidatus Kaiserbacteria bacterium]MCB9816245.1 hypothetical protein [Candidatus Nomurabacteria bacterium]
MNNVSEKQKDSVLKTLAIVGFIGVIILIAWLSVKFVAVAPGAFSSLASLAGTLNERESAIQETGAKQTFTVTSDATLVAAGTSVGLSWEDTETPGSYAFFYDCVEGVAIDLVNEDGVQSISCGTNYNLGKTTSLLLTIDSEKNRYTDVDYTVSFLGTNDTTPRASGTSSLTVVNSNISSYVPTTVATIDTELPAQDQVVVATPEPEIEAPIVETQPTPSVPTTPTYEQEYVYTIPTSDPNGRTDLGTRFIAAGSIVGNTFFSEAIKRGDDGAIQFAVKNYGTKTSAKWTFSVTLPGGGTYNSAEQQPLKPNEEATLTIGFPEAFGSSHTFVVTIDESTDRNTINDRFAQPVTFIN